MTPPIRIVVQRSTGNFGQPGWWSGMVHHSEEIDRVKTRRGLRELLGWLAVVYGDLLEVGLTVECKVFDSEVDWHELDLAGIRNRVASIWRRRATRATA